MASSSKDILDTPRPRKLSAYRAELTPQDRQNIKKAKEEFKKTYGVSLYVYIYKSNLRSLTKIELRSLQTELMKAELEGELTINSTKTFVASNNRSYGIRVHTKEERLSIDKIVKKVIRTS